MSRVEYDTTNWVESDIYIFDAIVEAEEQAISTAQAIVDQYWIKFDSANRTVINNKKAGQDPKRKTAVLAPVLERGKSTGRRINRLVWQVFGTKGYQRANRGAGKRVAYGRGDYEYTYNPNTLLKHSVGWDAQSIIEAEAKLEPIRLTLKNYQRLLVSMAAKYRRIDRLTLKREKRYGE